jgi:hypothetical protein
MMREICITMTLSWVGYTQAQVSPIVTTIDSSVYIAFTPEDTKEIIRWNEERISCKDYVNLLYNKTEAQEMIIKNYEQAYKNDSILIYAKDTINIEQKAKYRSLIGVNVKLNRELNECEKKVNARDKGITWLIFLSVIEGLWIALR